MRRKIKKIEEESYESSTVSTAVDSTNSSEFAVKKIEAGELTKKGKVVTTKKYFQRLNFWKRLSKKQKKYFLAGASVLGVFILSVGILFVDLFFSAKKLIGSVRTLSVMADNQDINSIKTELPNTKKAYSDLKSSFNRIYWLRVIPYFGQFVSDGRNFLNAGDNAFAAADIFLEAATPYSDLLGASGGDPQSTTQDRINFIVKTLPDLAPQVGELSQLATNIEVEMAAVDTQKYPTRLGGLVVRENLEDGIRVMGTTADFFKKGKPLLEVIPYLMGVEEARTYMIIFQNNKELRPTGGFITAYTIAKVENGMFSPGDSNDIYKLDEEYTPVIGAPAPLIDYIKGPYLISENYRLRDMNWNPDFKKSMELFTAETQKAGVEEVDGVIAVDTQLLVNLLDVIGEIQVEGFGGYSNNIVELCDCEQIIYELEHFADREGPIVWSENEPGKIVFAPENYQDRKQIIGPMMDTIVANVLGLPNQKMPLLFDSILNSINEKHILMYMREPSVQEALESFGVAGRIVESEGDYLYINDANLGGRKANLYVTQEVTQEIEIKEDGTIEKTLKVSYKNPKPQDNWLNSILPNYFRIYVPLGSELIEISGAKDTSEPYEEFGKTVFAGMVEVVPLGVSQISVKYKLPFKQKDNVYELYIQQQPGKKDSLYTFELGTFEEEVVVSKDKIFSIKIK